MRGDIEFGWIEMEAGQPKRVVFLNRLLEQHWLGATYSTYLTLHPPYMHLETMEYARRGREAVVALPILDGIRPGQASCGSDACLTQGGSPSLLCPAHGTEAGVRRSSR